MDSNLPRTISHISVGHGQFALLGLATAANFAQVGTRVVISPLVPQILTEFTVSKSAIGLVLSGMWVLFALMHYPSGVLAEKYGPRAIVIVALTCATLGSLMLSLADTFTLFTIAAILLGAGTGLYFVVGTALLTTHFEDDTGQVLGIHSSGGAIAGFAIPIVAVAITTQYSWRAGILSSTLVVFLVLILFTAGVPSKQPVRAADPLLAQLDPRNRLAILQRPGVPFALLLAIICVFSWQSILSFLPTFFVEYRFLSSEHSSFLYAIVFLTNALSMPLVGRLADRTGGIPSIVSCLLAVTTGFGIALFVDWNDALFLSAVLLGVGISWGGALQSLFMRSLPADSQGSGFGTIRTVYMLIGALGSAVTVLLADRFG